MNVILVLIDSLNLSSLSAYRDTDVSTPNLSEFARRSLRFDNHFVGSLPCMPARREIFTGFKELMWRPWGPLEPFHDRLPMLLAQRGYRTGIVTDHYHYWEEAANGYLQSFQSAELVRGHEVDFWKPPLPEGSDLPAWIERIERWRPGFGRRYYANVRDFEGEEDYFPAKVMNAACDWLRAHVAASRDFAAPPSTGGEPFFLQVESFDVHEPFDVPEPYASMYAKGGSRDEFNIWPPYQDPRRLAEFMAQASEEELEFIRAQYAGKLTMVDRWFGELMGTISELELWDETAIIVTTDHGHDLGERGVFGKQFPHLDSHANIPLMCWYPANPGGGRSSGALTSTVDLFSTILDIAGAASPDRLHSRSFLPVLNGERDTHRDALLYGTFGQGVCFTDGEWTIIRSPKADGPLHSYSSLQFHSLLVDEPAPPVGQGNFIPGVNVPQWQVPVQFEPLSTVDFLFHRANDPEQRQNLWDAEPEQRRRMLESLKRLVAEEGAPPEQFRRLELL